MPPDPSPFNRPEPSDARSPEHGANRWTLRARSYPFAIPDHSYLYEGGRFSRLRAGDVDRERRLPVLAAGSNQSPEQLGRKFASFPAGPASRIPAQRAALADFDVVYAAHLARYGSVPATLQASPGTAVTVFVLWLDEAQLAHMHRTETNYTFDRLRDISIACDDGETLRAAFGYSSKAGCLEFAGGCASLAEIPASGRRFPALSQDQALAAVRDRLAPGHALEIFVQDHVDDAALRRARCEALGEAALALDFPRETVTANRDLYLGPDPGQDGGGPARQREIGDASS